MPFQALLPTRPGGGHLDKWDVNKRRKSQIFLDLEAFQVSSLWVNVEAQDGGDSPVAIFTFFMSFGSRRYDGETYSLYIYI